MKTDEKKEDRNRKDRRKTFLSTLGFVGKRRKEERKRKREEKKKEKEEKEITPFCPFL